MYSGSNPTQTFWNRQGSSTSLKFPESKPNNRINVNMTSGYASTYPIPDLKVINHIVAATSPDIINKLKHSVVVACQHNLETTLTLYRALIKLGVRKVYSVGKCYSDSETIQSAMLAEGIQLLPSSKPPIPGQFQEFCRYDIRSMWDRCLGEIDKDIDTIIVLDDGGRCMEEMPPFARLNFMVAGIEQTRGGLYSAELSRLPFPVIEVASSALKREIEPIFIAKAVISVLQEKLAELTNLFHFNKNTVYGIIGNGAIGSAVAKFLLDKGYSVAIYDESDDAFHDIIPNGRFFRMSSKENLIANSECIFGCTGKDTLNDISLAKIVTKDTVFVSCTSEDREFLSALKSLQSKSMMLPNPLNDITYLSDNNSKIVIVRGGFPLNFNGKPWNVPATEIEPTQCALLGAVIQAAVCAKKPVGDGKTINIAERLMLDPVIQQCIVHEWRKMDVARQHTNALLDCFNDLHWVSGNSGGKYSRNEQLAKCFAPKTFKNTDLFSAKSSAITEQKSEMNSLQIKPTIAKQQPPKIRSKL